MIYSMTGFGKSELQIDQNTVSIELKSVNGKNAEFNIRLPMSLKAYEIQMRKLLTDQLMRGSIELSIQIKENGSGKPMVLNMGLAESYYKMIQEVSSELGLKMEDPLATLFRMPEIVSQDTETWDEARYRYIEDGLQEAIDELLAFRKSEGQNLIDSLKTNIGEIIEQRDEILMLDPERISTVKMRLQKSVDGLDATIEFDKNRLEQELLYYIEKMDIAEELQRLDSHCQYFLEVLDDSSTVTKGKKLNFITQEIGRELNTMGSKSYNANMQKIVVNMKDSLEKIKEQILNIL